MIFMIDFCLKEKNDFITLYSALIYSDKVGECKDKANEIALEKGFPQKTDIFIEEFLS